MFILLFVIERTETVIIKKFLGENLNSEELILKKILIHFYFYFLWKLLKKLRTHDDERGMVKQYFPQDIVCKIQVLVKILAVVPKLWTETGLPVSCWTNPGKSFRSSFEVGREIWSSSNSTLSLSLETNSLFMFRKFPRNMRYICRPKGSRRSAYD